MKSRSPLSFAALRGQSDAAVASSGGIPISRSRGGGSINGRLLHSSDEYDTEPTHSDSDQMYYHSQEDEAAGVAVRYRQVDDGVATGMAVGNGVVPLAGDASPDSHQAPPKHMYGSFVAYCFTVNYILGVGVLGMPYAFFKGGWALSTLCLAFVSTMATFTALWLVDVSLRAQYLKRQERLLQEGAVSDGETIEAAHQPVSTANHHRYEMNELTEIFLGLKFRRFYELLVIIYLVGALWSYSSVFASSLASHVPFPGVNDGKECDIYKDSSQGCSDLYLLYMGLFSLVAIPLTCLDLTEMMTMQIALAIFRFVSLGAMMITSIVAMYSYPNPDPDAHSSASVPYYSSMPAFDWSNLGLIFPIAIYAQIFHHSVPGLSHPLKDKRESPRVFAGVIATTFALYTALGVSVALYYGASIPQTCTLAWATYSGGHDAPGESKPWWAVFISYLVVLFPPIDIISAFPLNAITLGNNMLCSFIKDHKKQQMKRYKIPFRLIAAIPPIAGALVVRDLSTILKYTGCVGVLIAFVFPCMLQWASRIKCATMGAPTYIDEDAAEEGSAIRHKAPTYNVGVINRKDAIWVVLSFSIVGLVAVIVLSVLGLSN